LHDGEFDQVPYEVDPLSTAVRVLQTREQYGKDSQEYRTIDGAFTDDTSSLIEETLLARKSGLLSKYVQVYAPEGDYMARGVRIGPMLDNGITPLASLLDRRFMERREGQTHLAMGRLLMKVAGVKAEGLDDVPVVGLPKEIRQAKTVRMLTISGCPPEVAAQYEADVAAGCAEGKMYGGYMPWDEAGMFRWVTFNTENQTLVEQQVRLSGKYITQDAIKQYLIRKRAVDAETDLTVTELLGKQFIITEEQDPVEMIRELDILASVNAPEGKRVFKGELVDADHPCDYQEIIRSAESNAKLAVRLAPELKMYLLELAESGIDHWSANQQVATKVRSMVLKAVEQDVEAARGAFGDETANKLSAAIILEQDGDADLARRLRNSAEETAPGASFCGAGSCGLENINELTAEGKQAAKDVKAEAGDMVLLDTQRTCKCGKKTIVYAFNATKVNKYCTSCKSFESKKTTGGTAPGAATNK
jgi:hypothetical protein